jgi:hypothetical protein
MTDLEYGVSLCETCTRRYELFIQVDVSGDLFMLFILCPPD